MNNSFHSDNFIFLINAASQVLTLSNIPAQSPSASPPRPSRKVHQKGCIRLIFYVHPIGNGSPVISKITEKLFERVNFVDKVPTSSGLYECLLKDNATAEFKCTDRMRQQKKKILHKLCIDMERSEYTSFSMLAILKCEFQWTSILISRYMDSRG